MTKTAYIFSVAFQLLSFFCFGEANDSVRTICMLDDQGNVCNSDIDLLSQKTSFKNLITETLKKLAANDGVSPKSSLYDIEITPQEKDFDNFFSRATAQGRGKYYLVYSDSYFQAKVNMLTQKYREWPHSHYFVEFAVAHEYFHFKNDDFLRPDLGPSDEYSADRYAMEFLLKAHPFAITVDDIDHILNALCPPKSPSLTHPPFFDRIEFNDSVFLSLLQVHVKQDTVFVDEDDIDAAVSTDSLRSHDPSKLKKSKIFTAIPYYYNIYNRNIVKANYLWLLYRNATKKENREFFKMEMQNYPYLTSVLKVSAFYRHRHTSSGFDTLRYDSLLNASLNELIRLISTTAISPEEQKIWSLNVRNKRLKDLRYECRYLIWLNRRHEIHDTIMQAFDRTHDVEFLYLAKRNNYDEGEFVEKNIGRIDIQAAESYASLYSQGCAALLNGDTLKGAKILLSCIIQNPDSQNLYRILHKIKTSALKYENAGIISAYKDSAQKFLYALSRSIYHRRLRNGSPVSKTQIQYENNQINLWPPKSHIKFVFGKVLKNEQYFDVLCNNFEPGKYRSEAVDNIVEYLSEILRLYSYAYSGIIKDAKVRINASGHADGIPFTGNFDTHEILKEFPNLLSKNVQVISEESEVESSLQKLYASKNSNDKNMALAGFRGLYPIEKIFLNNLGKDKILSDDFGLYVYKHDEIGPEYRRMELSLDFDLE